MNAFEKWQIINSLIQSVLLLVTFLGALFIGFKQNEINQNLLELNYTVSVDLNYDSHKLNIYNKGKENIWLYGTKLGDGKDTVETTGRLISPGGSYYLLTDKIEPEILLKAGQNGETTVPFDVYVESQIKNKYVIKNLLFIVVKNGNITIHCQTISILRYDWTSKN